MEFNIMVTTMAYWNMLLSIKMFDLDRVDAILQNLQVACESVVVKRN